MLFVDVAEVCLAVARTTKRNDKVAVLAACLGAADLQAADEVAIAVGLIVGSPRQSRLGVGWATLVTEHPPADHASLTLTDIDVALTALARIGGAGSQRERGELIGSLMARATAVEQTHLRRVVLGDVRIGANDGVVADAAARAFSIDAATMRRAAMLLGDLGTAAQRAHDGQRLESIGLTPSIGVQPMLASTAASVADALDDVGPASVEWKLDGARIQVHRTGSDVRVLTRSLRDITAAVPSIVASVAGLDGGDLVLDGEALGLDADGGPLKFQDTMRAHSELRPFFFDVLYAHGESLIDLPLAARKQRLHVVVPDTLRLPSIDHHHDASLSTAESFAAAALAAGHEGVMVKALDSPYQAGRRGAAWRKVKPVLTFDLVVLAVERGSGRRTGWLSNIHLGAASGDGGFVMVGKTFKGMTDDILRWQTEHFTAIAVHDDGYTVHVQPTTVVEVAIDGVQRSRRYPGGVALRFARVKRYRPDKHAADADGLARLQALL